MKEFAQLIASLSSTTGTNARLTALEHYFLSARPEDAAWALYFLCGNKFRRQVSTLELREAAISLSGLPEWLYEECRSTVGDTAETLALLVPDFQVSEEASITVAKSVVDASLEQIVCMISKAKELPAEERQHLVLGLWSASSRSERFVINKMLTGGFRVGVSQKMVLKALHAAFSVPLDILAQRMMGTWEPTGEFYLKLVSEHCEDEEVPLARPYPFYLASPLTVDPVQLGPIEDWQVEYKWDGIRAQLIHRGGSVFLWSRGEELITEQFPELAEAASDLPDGVVLDGEIVAGGPENLLGFSSLQRRLGRKRVSAALLKEVPVTFIAYDLLENRGEDLRTHSQELRSVVLRELLEFEMKQPRETCIQLAEALVPATWSEVATLRENSRALGVEGVMLKLKGGEYKAGRVRGEWYKWKVDPLSLDAVMIYAQKGRGRRAGLFSDYTFAVWNHEGDLVPIAKAYSGLTDAEMKRVDSFVRSHTTEAFGPVRSVEPTMVFELAFEGISHSKRHKSGFSLRFPRIARIRDDKLPEHADTLASVENLYESLTDPTDN